MNGRALNRPVTGVERYTVEVVRRLEGRVQVLRPAKRLTGPLGHLWEQLLLPLQVSRGAALWSPANSGPLALARQVVTLHDLSPLEHPEWFQPAFAALYRAMLPPLLRRARWVVVPSRYTRGALLRRFPDLTSKVAVVPGGVDQGHFYPREREEIEALRRAYRLPDTYVLTVGTRQPRKNLRRLHMGWELAAPALPGVELVLAGDRGVQFRREDLGPLPAGVRLLGYVPDGLLPALYTGAAAFILPALEEGFGLPLLEALACGVPTAAAGCGALPELAAGVSRLFDPFKPESIAACLETILETGRGGELSCLGQERAALYPWERTAAGVLELLEASTG